MKRSLAAIIAALLLTTGCLGFSSPREPIRINASAPFTTIVQDDGTGTELRQRTVPWVGQTLTARVPLPTAPNDPDRSLSPGLESARAQLSAGDRARDDLASQLLNLPASAPIPGQPRGETLQEFAQNRPALAASIDTAIQSASTELEQTGDRSFFVARLPLAPIANAVLQHGGGFAVDSAVIQQLGPEAQAERDAINRAQAELLRRVVELEVRRGTLVRAWVNESPRNRDFLLTSIRNAPVARRDRIETESGPAINVEIEFDQEAFLRAAREMPRGGR